MYRQARRVALPPPTVRLPRILPLSRLNGATPTRAAAWRRVSEPSSGSSASRVRALTGPTPGTERSSSSLARQTALSRTAVPRSRSIPASASSEPAQVGVDPLVQGGIGRVAPVALGDQHLEQLTAARHQGAEVAGGLEHDQRRREGGQALSQGRHALVVVADR